jgi:hypothetical protein
MHTEARLRRMKLMKAEVEGRNKRQRRDEVEEHE